MKVLALSDERSKYLYDHFSPEKLDGIELILACGDLPAHYLEFFATMSRAPLVYVPGNHDVFDGRKKPSGCICADGRVIKVNGKKIMGLGGSMKYQPDRPNQYTEGQMRWRMLKLLPRIWLLGGVDIFMAHSPARGVGDLEDLPHRGFECFHILFKKPHAPVFVHGHVHREYGCSFKREMQLGATRVINACGHYIFEI